jgi:hypothetical protein
MLSNSPVEEGEELCVVSRVKNTGRRSDTQELKLFDIYGNLVDSKKVHLFPYQEKEVELCWETDYGDEGCGEVVVKGEDSLVTEPVQIELGFR